MPVTAATIRIDGTPTNGADPWIDSLVLGGAWRDSDGGTVTITWSTTQGFMGGENSLSWSQAEIASLREALAAWESVANIDFVEVADSSSTNIRFWKGTDWQALGALGWSDLPGYEGAATTGYYVVYNGEESSWQGGRAKGGLGFLTLVHEIGHVLGLAHPHDGGPATDGSNFPGVTDEFYDYGDHALNQGIYTTMGYNQGWPTFYSGNTSETYGLQAGPMALDIAAIQAIYGANTNYAGGNNVYVLPTANQIGTYWSSIWDTGGVDTISNEGSSNNAVIDLRPADAGINGGGYVSYSKAQYSIPGWTGKIDGGYTIARGVIIENAIGGSGNDTITGNAAVNRLEGGRGDDILDGGAGADTMIGGSGYDTYYVDDVGDVIVDPDEWGIDTVYSTISFVLAATLENLFLTGAANTNGTGNGLGNTLIGNAGDNTLVGGGGADMFDGGAGNDRIVVNDFAFNYARGGEGVDTLVLGGAGYSIYLPAATLTSKISGFEHFDITGTGDNTLTLDQATVLARGEWVGIKRVLVVERDQGDTVQFADSGWTKAGSAFNANGSFDRWVFGNAEVHIEKDKGESIVGTAGADIISVTVTVPGQPFATELNDVIDGAGGDDYLDGGAGNDVLDGGTGVDTAGYSTSPGSIRVDLVAGTAQDGFSYLDQLIDIENVAGSAFGDEIYGNGSANRLLGNDGGDSLYGGAGDDLFDGGAGSDVLVGGDGADALSGGDDADYLLIDGADTVIDGGAGFDSAFVQTVAPVTLDMGAASIEWIQGNAGNDIFNASSQTSAVYIYGMGGDDTLTGSAFGDYLDGGDGTDTLAGGDGADLMLGNGGSDILRGEGGDDSLIELGGDSVIDGGAGFDSLFVWSDTGVTLDLTAASIEWVQGSVLGDDHLDGAGNTVNTFLYGWGGNDVLTAGSADDYIAGGAGDDVLTGGAGNDTMIGETGFDRYVYTAATWGADTIHSFDFNGEKLDFTAVAAIHAFSDFTTYEWDPLGLGYNSTTLFYTSGGTTSAITLIGVQTASLSDADFLFA